MKRKYRELTWRERKPYYTQIKRHRCNISHGCEVCNDCVSESLTWHHIYPQSRGGSHEASNLSLLCKRCHVMWHRFEEGIRYEGIKLSKQHHYWFKLWKEVVKLNNWKPMDCR